MAEEVERIFVIPLRKRNFKSSNAAPTAVKRVKDYIKRHMKVSENDVWIDSSLNEALWSFGMYKMPRKIKVKAVKFEDGVVEAYLPELEFKKSIRELLKEEKEKKEPILRKEEAKVAEETPKTPGAEGYEIAPTGEGEVKIKKKKAPKKKVEKKEPTEEIPVKKEKEKKEKEKNEGKEEKKAKSKKKSEEGKKPKKQEKIRV